MMQIAEKIHEIDSYEFSGTQDPARVAQALPSRPPARAPRPGPSRAPSALPVPSLTAPRLPRDARSVAGSILGGSPLRTASKRGRRDCAEGFAEDTYQTLCAFVGPDFCNCLRRRRHQQRYVVRERNKPNTLVDPLLGRC